MDPKKKIKYFTYALWLGGFIALLGIGAGASYFKEYPAENKREPSAEERQANSDLAKATAFIVVLKRNNKDPDSFKLHSVGMTDKGAACIEYSGTNSFNAQIRDSAVLSRDGKTTLTTSDGNKFVAAWNKYCANQQMRDELALATSVIARIK